MKKIAVLAACLIVGLCAVSAPEAAPAVDTTVADFEASLNQLNMFPIPIPHCGDYCDTPGQSRGCIDSSGSSANKVECTCTGGTWTCY
jgi:hypothetical protein